MRISPLNKKFLIIGIVTLALVLLLIWLFIESSKPLPGTKVADLGRGHIPITEKFEYNSNPPTSGKHYEDWVRSGVYSEPKEDGNLVHSLEHGYAIISYNCDRKISFIPLVLAHEAEDTPVSEATPSANLPESFKTDECHRLVDQLISIYEKKGKIRIIVVPRPILDSRIALTAWNYIDKFDRFDQTRIEKFIDAHLNQGPEKTME